MFDDLTLPLIALGAVVAFIVLAIISSVMSKRSRRESVDLAAMQAEKDVMRANHAVEIAALERRLAAAQSRGHGGGDSAIKIAEQEGIAAGLRKEIERLKHDAAHRQQGLHALTEERDSLARTLSERTAERDKAAADAAKADAEAKERARTITELRQELATATNRLVRPDAAPSGPTSGDFAAAQAAKGVAEREAKALREERDTLRARLEERVTGTVADLVEARKTIAARDTTIAELRAALAPRATDTDDQVSTLTAALHAVEGRERIANEQLSRLSYDLDQLRGTIASHERVESEARAKVEKNEALLELRQQKIYELEARVRELGEAAREGGTDPRLGALEERLDTVRGEKDALLSELEAMRRDMDAAASATPDGGELAALRRDVEALRAENAALKSAGAASPDEVAALREELRTLAEKFITMAGTAPTGKPGEEPSLAERIRAFKAARASS